MAPLKISPITLAVAGGITGWIAAYYWLASSKLPVTPGPKLPKGSAPETDTHFAEPPEREDKTEAWVAGTLDMLGASARLNTKAARWTAVSVFLSAAAGVLGSL